MEVPVVANLEWIFIFMAYLSAFNQLGSHSSEMCQWRAGDMNIFILWLLIKLFILMIALSSLIPNMVLTPTNAAFNWSAYSVFVSIIHTIYEFTFGQFLFFLAIIVTANPPSNNSNECCLKKVFILFIKKVIQYKYIYLSIDKQ